MTARWWWLVVLVACADSDGCAGQADDAYFPYADCGNDQVDGAEPCDGYDGVPSCEELGFEDGESVCLPDCTEVDVSGCAIAPSGVVLNEVNSESEAFEVYNAGPVEVTLTGWTAVDRAAPDESGRAFTFPAGEVLQPGEVLLVLPDFGLGSEDLLVLRDATQTVRDAVQWVGGADSQCRMPDGEDWRGCAQSLGELNLP